MRSSRPLESGAVRALGRVGLARRFDHGAVSPQVRRRALQSVSIIPFLVMGLDAAHAQPVGGSVVAGKAQISSSGATTIINQTTAKAVINWQDFSVSSGGAVQFNQPGSSSVTLNRVTGSNASDIEGAI